MSENETKVGGVEEEEIEELEEPSLDTDWEARARKLESQAIVQRERTRALKAELSKLGKAVLPDKKEEKKGFDNADKALLIASGIPRDDHQLVWKWMQETGKEMDDVLDNKYFQTELQDAQEERKSRNAIPTGSKRATLSSRDSVEYWLAKEQMPPESERALREAYVNAKMKEREQGSQFTTRPIV